MKGLFVYLAPSDTAYQIESESEYAVQVRPKLGFLYLSSALKAKKGISCDILDQTVARFDIEGLASRIKSEPYLFIGFYSAISMDGRVTECVKKLRGKYGIRVPIIMGGPSFVKAEVFLRAGCDIVCNGEGEDTICDIAEYLTGRMKIEDVKGISYLKNGDLVRNEPRQLIADMDSLTFPDYDAVDIKMFHDFYIFTMRKPYTTMMASRGCPFNCSFCESPGIWGRKYRTRSVDNVLSEIDYLVGKYSVRYIAFQDDVFGMDYEWAEEFCGKLKARRHDLRWMCILHPFSFKKDRAKMFELLKGAGCDTVSTGLQSAHPEILKRLNRSPDEPEGIRQIVRAARRSGVLSLVSFIFGSPGETLQTIQVSIDYAMQVRPNYARFYSMVILPGSEIARKYGADGKLCGISESDLNELCRQATRKFFMKPDILFPNLFFVMINNPKWFLATARHAFHILDTIGVGKAAKPKDYKLICKPGA